MKKLFSTVAVLASIIGLLYLVYNMVMNHCHCCDDDEDLYMEEFDDCDCCCDDDCCCDCTDACGCDDTCCCDEAVCDCTEEAPAEEKPEA